MVWTFFVAGITFAANSTVFSSITNTTYLTSVTVLNVGCDSHGKMFAQLTGSITNRSTGVVSSDQFSGWVAIPNKEMYATFLNIKNNGGSCTTAYIVDSNIIPDEIIDL